MMKKKALVRTTSFSYGKDALLCSILVLVSTILIFFNLGVTKCPQTSYVSDGLVFIDFGEPVEFESVMFILGGTEGTGGFALHAWNGGDATKLLHEESRDTRFRWFAFEFAIKTRYVIIEPDNNRGTDILEMGFYSHGKLVKLSSVTPAAASSMFDESRLIPEDPSFMNDIIFDEEVQVLTAYDFIHVQPPHEKTHPPLAMVIIAFGINLFGMMPFGWRFFAAVFGILMVIPVYALGKRMFGTRLPAFLAAFIFTFDFMHFVQSRVATIDVFLVTFIICMYLFMYKYTKVPPENRLAPKSLMYLGFSGVFMGLAISAKWTGVFAGLGLGLIFALSWLDSRAYYANLKIKGLYFKDFAKTALWCILFFIAVPVVIYSLSYIPFTRASGTTWLSGMLEHQAYILNLHTNLDLTHDYQSRWWTWPLNLNQMHIYRRNMPEGLYRGISSFGNPALWWGGLLAFFWCIKRWIVNKDKTARFLSIAWVIQIVPWVFITRLSFVYHYFPNVPFLALMAAYFIKTRSEKRQKWYVLGYCALALILFAVFYPVLSGMDVSSDYVQWLQWLPGWNFTGMNP